MYLALLLALALPADWVPVRWKSAEPKSLGIVAGTPVNCLLLEWKEADRDAIAAFAAAAREKGIVTLGVVTPAADAAQAARAIVNAKLSGVVLEGEFPEAAIEKVKDSLSGSEAALVELTSRRRMKLNGTSPIIGTYQAVWPGIQIYEDGHAKAGPTGSPWIDTNAGFIRSVRAYGNFELWLGNQPPENTVVTGERYLQAIADAGIVGARWVLAFDRDFNQRLLAREEKAIKDWEAICRHLKFFEEGRVWRSLSPHGQLAVVQDVSSGALLSGGILDMIAAKHTPVRPIPSHKLRPEALKGATMAVNVDNEALRPEERQVLRTFTRAGNTVLTGPPGWKAPTAAGEEQITLEKEELERLNDIWRDVQAMIGRKNLGARLFNVSSMLSNVVASEDGKRVVVQLVNYSGYPIEAIAVHLIGDFKRARLYTPDGQSRDLQTYKNEENTGVDIDSVGVCAALLVE
ncbi:MAG: hypothetical protein WD696_19185 [Bryobacteraceae bacterium]